MREVTISKVMNGFIVKVGCQVLVFESQPTLMCELSLYLQDPEGTEKRYQEKYSRDFLIEVGQDCPSPASSPDPLNLGSAEQYRRSRGESSRFYGGTSADSPNRP